jgi:hypothetical protein
MSDDPQWNAALDPTFFEGRFIVDILSWDWNLRVSATSAAGHDGLDYGRHFTIMGRVRAPRELRGKTMKVTLSPFGPKVRFGRGGAQQVGLLTGPRTAAEFDFEATLSLPEEATPTTATSLASIWKHLQMLTVDEGAQETKISAYFFGAEIPANLQAWADAD